MTLDGWNYNPQMFFTEAAVKTLKKIDIWRFSFFTRRLFTRTSSPQSAIKSLKFVFGEIE